MSAFHEELIAARKAKGMTQEQLAEAMNASRSAVSHWESGRSTPDVVIIRQLSMVLGCTFSIMTVSQNDVRVDGGQPAEQAIPTEETPTRDVPVKQPAKRLMLAIAAVAVIVLIVCIAVSALRGKPRDGEPSAENYLSLQAVVPPKANSVEWFSSPVQPQSGKPFVAVQFNENPLRLVRDEIFSGGTGWLYTVYLTETNGFALTMKSIDIVIFKAKGDADGFTYDANVLNDWFNGSHDMPAKGQLLFEGGMPFSDNLVGVGICVTGTDESGEELDFHAYLPLSQEIRE